MLLQNWWYTTLLGQKYTQCPPLKENIKTDVLIVGGGMAGLSAALRLMNSGKKITLLERNICGGSSTGKSAGFLTPDSEIELAQLLRRFGPSGARELWNVATSGGDSIVSSIRKYKIDCDLQEQPSLFLGIGNTGQEAVLEESKARKEFGFDYSLYDAKEISKIIGSDGYLSGISYDKTFSINPLQYAQGIKQILIENNVTVFESSEVISLENNRVKTHLGSVDADEIIFCADKLKPTLTEYAQNIYHAQTFLSISEPLEKNDVESLFPNGPFQCWDSDLIYTYFRLTGDNRLLIGGGDVATTFSKNDTNSPAIINKVIEKMKKRIPILKHIDFIQYWPGRIDLTRDLLPTIIRKPETNTHFVLGCVGLPWASFCGNFVAEHILGKESDRYYQYFSANRKFLIPLSMQKILGKKLVFTINSSWAKYKQKEKTASIEFNDENW
jgi:gamma-glutamylputrescine oxidase